MSDKHIVKVRMLGACVIITVPAAVREITGIESGNYVYVETTGKRGFTVVKGAIPAKKAAPKKAAKPAAKKKVLLSKKKVVKPAAPTPKKKSVAKLAPKKLTAPPKKIGNKPASNAVLLMAVTPKTDITLPESY